MCSSDLLPYKVGVDLRTAWLNPESERMDEDREQHETILVYRNRRTGEVREFALDDPEWQNDELWEWEETRTHFETPSIRPIISEFALRDPSGDITEEVLRTEGRLYMICIASFDRVRRGCAHRLRMLIERADREGASVLCLTPGPLNEEARHAFLGSRPVRCCNIDVHTLKTLLRANNGVVVLEDGVITAKMNCRDIPL